VQQCLDGSDGLGGTGFTRDQLQRVMLNNRTYGAELHRPHSAKQWIDLLFSARDVRAATVETTRLRVG
jgi:hypothetical protein